MKSKSLIIVLSLVAVVGIGVFIYSNQPSATAEPDNTEAEVRASVSDAVSGVLEGNTTSTATSTTEESVDESIDSDNDGLTDAEEKEYRTDIHTPDTDRDGYLDGEEVDNGYDPLGPGKLIK